MSTRVRLPSASLLLSLALLACTGKSDDTGAEPGLPDETDTQDLSGDSVALIADTYDDALGDEEPAHWLALAQEGVWELTPRGGPWTTLTGSLLAVEVLDEEVENPLCEVSYALTGEEAPREGCDTCEVAFLVSFYVNEGDPAACADPDLPRSDEERVYGWSEVDSTIYLDYAGTGLWIPWYEGAADEDTITFSWTGELGKAVEEDEDE